MWITKWQRDKNKGVDSPFPTQIVSNEEFLPRPQTAKQARLERLIGSMAAENAKRLGMDRRLFMRSSMGMATCFLASRMCWARCFACNSARVTLSFERRSSQEATSW